jgi:hypothetical protein
LAIPDRIFRWATIGLSPDELGNTTSPFLDWTLITAHAASDNGRSEAPVLVSASRAVRSAKPSQVQHFATASVGQNRQPRGIPTSPDHPLRQVAR